MKWICQSEGSEIMNEWGNQLELENPEGHLGVVG